MGLFKKAKGRNCARQERRLIDPAVLGGPSTRSVAVDNPIWQPINGISLQDYAELARDAQARGINDEAGMIALSQERAWNPADTKAAHDGWVAADGPVDGRGQQFRTLLGYLTGSDGSTFGRFTRR